MAKLISVEKTKYINENIERYSQNKIGQYSKFLNKNPIFVTYYSINIQESRSDVGTGGIQSELGASSPIRFNKILNLPVYNIPTISPDIQFDETGYDIDIDLNDIVVLPNTVKPTPGDYMLLALPGSPEILFRVNDLKHNTIQSNDFYQIDLDIKDVGTDLENKRVKNQIIQEYQTVFENIGTQDKCFILLQDIDKANSVVKTVNTLKEMYKNLYYNNLCNSFVCAQPVIDPSCPVNGNCNCSYLIYDPYLEKYLNRINLFNEDNEEDTLILVPNDFLPKEFEYNFSRSIWNAIYTRDLTLLNKYTYYYLTAVSSKFSSFQMNSIDAGAVILCLLETPLVPVTTNNPNARGVTRKTITECIPVSQLSEEYFDISLIDQIEKKVLTSTDYLDKLIYNYFNNIKEDIDTNLIIKALLHPNKRNFYMEPIVMYILLVYYNEFFKKTTTDI